MLKEHQIALGVSVVGNDRGESEKENGDGDKRCAPTADGGGEGPLGHIDAADVGYRLIQHAGGENDRGRGAANNDGIDEYPEHLHVTLRGGMRRIR
ncbi:hypothetical protein D3C80_1886350 [compost metagenome]